MGYFTPTSKKHISFTDKGKFILIWRLSILFSTVFTFLAVFSIFYDPNAIPIFASVAFIASVCFVYIHKTENFKLTFWIYSISATVISCISLLLPMHTIHLAEYMWFFSVIVFVFIGLGRKYAMYFVLFVLAAAAVHIFYFLNDQISILRPHSMAERIGLYTETFFALFSVVFLIHQYLVFQSYSESQMELSNRELNYQNSLIIKKNDENSILMKEIHHRVKNNLQIIISLLRMQREEIQNEESKMHFTEAINRILTMSLIHQKLYSEKTITTIKVEQYAHELVEGIMQTLDVDVNEIRVKINSEISFLDLDTILPLGLILNELITNSIKHAFESIEKREIHISFVSQGPNRVILTYFDNGVWKNNENKQRGFGKELIYLLTDQINGVIGRNGSRYILEFPVTETFN